MSSNRILFFHSTNDYSGSTKVLSDLIGECLPGTEVKVLTRDRNGKGFLSDNPDMEIVNVWWRPTVHGRKIPVLSELLYRAHLYACAFKHGRGYDVFYINTIIPYYAAVVGKLLGKKVVYHVHEYCLRKNSEIRRAEFVFDHVKARRIFVSDYTRRAYRDNGSPSEVIFNGLSQAFRDGVSARPAGLHNLDTVIMIGSYTRAKGIPAFFSLARKLPQYRFILVAGTDLKDPEREAGFGPHPENVAVHFNCSDVREYLAQADVLVSLTDPALWVETFGMTIIEGFAFGLPAIVPAFGGPVEIVENGRDGILLEDVTDIDSVAAAVSGLLSDRQKYESMAEAARLASARLEDQRSRDLSTWKKWCTGEK